MKKSFKYKMNSFGQPRQQRGVVLLVSLIMLGIFTVIVVSMIGGSNTNFKIAGNQQFRMEAKMVARRAAEFYINSFPDLPDAADLAVDLDGDGVAELTAVVPDAVCVRGEDVNQTTLDSTDPDDQQCFKSFKPNNPGQISDSGSNTGGSGSLCEKVLWDIEASIPEVASNTGVALELHQGISLRALVGTSCL